MCSSLCSFLHSPHTSSLLGPNILLSTIFSNTLSVRFSFQFEKLSFTPVHNNRQSYILNMRKEIQLDATQWFIEFMIRSTLFGHYYPHHQEHETIQIFTACGT